MTRTSRLFVRYTVVIGVCLVAVPFATRGPRATAPAQAIAPVHASAMPATLPALPQAATKPTPHLLAENKVRPASPPRHPLPPTSVPEEPAPLASVLGSPAPPLPAPSTPPAPLNVQARALLHPAPVRDWLPPANPLLLPRILPADSNHVAVAPRAADLPELALSQAGPQQEVILPAGVLVSAASVDTEHLFTRPPETTPDPHAASAVDPTERQSNTSAVAAQPPMRQTPAPFANLVIPQPEDSEAAQVKDPLPDNDAPVAYWDYPARPPLPVAKK